MIKLLIPKVPNADALLPYLRRIDEARWYTNFGQLVCELEQRLGKRYQGAHVVTVSSCTSGLEIAFELYKSMGLDEITLSPLTFQATALAARRAGLQVRFRDPDKDTWCDGTVAAFGVPAYRGPVVDAAAAFGEQHVNADMVAVFSLHATKMLPAGEGGFIVTHDEEEAHELRSMTNFGFLRSSRTAKYKLGFSVSRGPGTNAKLSEYHAAVALAGLDAWDTGAISSGYLQLFDWYAKYLPTFVVQQKRKRGIYPIIAVKLPCSAGPVAQRMHDDGVETRRWYTPPLYRHPLFGGDPHDFPVCEELNDKLLGLPWHLFLSEEDIVQVCDALTRAVGAQ